MSKSFSLRIFVADGDPDGLRVVERWHRHLAQGFDARLVLDGEADLGPEPKDMGEARQ